MLGSCLCGTVKFKLQIDKLTFYQCHCEQCRKQSGTASSCGSVVKSENFEWLSNTDSISTWEKDSGFTSHFCSTCGSSVPNQFRAHPFYWIPVGLVEDGEHEIVANIFTCEKAIWSHVDSQINPYPKRPEIQELLEMLCGNSD